MKGKAIIILGPQGSGKNTQLRLLQEKLEQTGKNVFVNTTGDKFRALASSEGFTSDMVRGSLRKGNLQPDFLASFLVLNNFINNYNGEEFVLIEGFPRKVLQAAIGDDMLQYYGLDVHAIIFTLSRETSRERILERAEKEGRDDDTPESIKHRLDLYEEKTVPVFQLFKEKGYHIHEISAENSIEEIHKDIIEALNI